MDSSSISFLFKSESSPTVIAQWSNQNKKELPSQLWSLQINPVNFPVQITEAGNALCHCGFSESAALGIDQTSDGSRFALLSYLALNRFF